jgi:hypothetical protein
VTSSIDVSSSNAAWPSTAISSDCERDLCADILTGCRDSSTETTKPKPSVEGTIDSDLHLESSDYALDNLRLCFRLFGPSILV